MPLSLRVLAGLLNPISTVLPVARIPRAGEQITYLRLLDPICRGSRGAQLLKRLVQQIRRLAYREGIDILTLFVYVDDPIGQLPRFFPQQVLRYDTVAIPLRGDEPPKERLYLDVRDT